MDTETRVELEKIELKGITTSRNELGRGSYAVVLELEYRGLKCAGKKLHRDLYEAGIGYAAHRYLEECRLLSQTRHPSIVQFLGVYFEGTSQFPILVMEFLPTNLTKCLERYGILPDEISYSILYDVSLGLAYLHGHTPAIIHRDLSANNILLTTNMRAKISDLGVAKIVDMNPLTKMTKSPGTQAYMPPEVMVEDPQYGVAVDEFSFGALIIHVCTAEWPAPKLGPTIVDPADPEGVIALTELERREDLIRKIEDHPLLDLIRRCLSNNPDLRPHEREIVEQISDLVLCHPSSFENKVEILQRFSDQNNQTRELQEEVDRGIAAFQEKEIECEVIQQTSQENIALLRTELTNIRSHIGARSQDKLELKQVADCPVCTLFGQAIVIEGTLFYGGGENDDNYRVHFYTHRSNTWTKLRPHTLTRFGLGEMNGKLITVGGHAKDEVSSAIYSITRLNRRWKARNTSVPTARCYPTVISLSSYIIVAGGVVSMKPAIQHTNAVEIYDTTAAQWTRAKELPVAGVFMNGGIQNNTLYMIGGINGARNGLNKVYTTTMEKLLSSQQQQLLQEVNTNETIWNEIARSVLFAPSAFISSGMILTIGGHTATGSCTGGIYAYFRSQNSWNYVGNLPLPASTAAVALLSPNECYVVGGNNETGQQLHSVYKCTFNLSLL